MLLKDKQRINLEREITDIKINNHRMKTNTERLTKTVATKEGE